jgi:hypothetical protein
MRLTLIQRPKHLTAASGVPFRFSHVKFPAEGSVQHVARAAADVITRYIAALSSRRLRTLTAAKEPHCEPAFRRPCGRRRRRVGERTPSDVIPVRNNEQPVSSSSRERAARQSVVSRCPSRLYAHLPAAEAEHAAGDTRHRLRRRQDGARVSRCGTAIINFRTTTTTYTAGRDLLLMSRAGHCVFAISQPASGQRPTAGRTEPCTQGGEIRRVSLRYDRNGVIPAAPVPCRPTSNAAAAAEAAAATPALGQRTEIVSPK